MVQLKVLLNGTTPNPEQAASIDEVYKSLLNITRQTNMPVTQTYKQLGDDVLVKLAHTGDDRVIMSCRFGIRGGMKRASKQLWL